MEPTNQGVKKRRTRRNPAKADSKEMTQIDSTEARLTTHELVCAERYAGIETKMTQIDKRFDRIEEDIKEMRNSSSKGFAEIKELIEKRHNSSHTAIITAAGGVIVALIGFLGYLIVNVR